MTDSAALVRDLYRHYGTWRKVADACGGVQPGSYWQQIKAGDIKNPSQIYADALEKAHYKLQCRLTRCKRRKFQRKNITVATSLFHRLNSVREENSLSWNEVITMLLERMGE